MRDEQAERIAELDARNRELETRYTHLQRIVDELNGVVIDQGKKLDALDRQLTVLARQLGSFADREPEPRSLEEDKPPHY